MPLFDQDKYSGLLKTRWAGKRLIYLNSCDSTNEIAKNLKIEEALKGTLILSEHQTAGRGRWGRKWEGQNGRSLLMTLVLPSADEQSTAARMGAALSVGLRNACTASGAAAIKIKWPNDLMGSGRKLAGVLMESLPNGIAAGIGFNVNQNPGDFPEDINELATSLRIEKGQAVERETFLAEAMLQIEWALERLEREGFETIKQEWHRSAAYLGDPVRVKTASEIPMEGTMMGLDSDGALLIRQDQGLIVPVAAGDLLNLRPVLT